MIFSFDEATQFMKFANKYDKTRYNCFQTKTHGSYILRPSKSSKNLDTAIYNGQNSKDLDNFLKEKFDIIMVSEITFMKE